MLNVAEFTLFNRFPMSDPKLFPDLNDTDSHVTEVESLCVQCEEQGVTRMLLTRIPHFREVVVMAFTCPHCHFRSSEVQPASTIQPRGARITTKITTAADLNRQVLKNNSATVRIPELDFEIPPTTQNGILTTVEGIVSNAIEGLASQQEARREAHPDVAQKLDAFLERMRALLALESSFTLIVDDPSGNSHVESLTAPAVDPAMNTTTYIRTRAQCELLGIGGGTEDNTDASNATGTAAGQAAGAVQVDQSRLSHDEVVSIPSHCPSCAAPVDVKLKLFDVPHFKDVVIMAVTCEACGHRSNEVKSGGAVSAKGRRVCLHVLGEDDLNRDVLKSDTAMVRVEEIGLECVPGTLGGAFTTVEGLLRQIYDQLKEQHTLSTGDSAPNTRMGDFLRQMECIMDAKMPFHFVLDDPCGNSYLQNLYAPDPDPEMTVEEYDRTDEQNEELGLNDMNVDHYD